jgi:nicotinamidase-related amidase
VGSAPCDLVVEAPGWDATFATSLEVELRQRGITTLALAGLASEWTVDSTVRTLNDRGFECLVLTDGCAPVDHDLGARAHASLTMSGGIFGALGTIPALIAALDAAHLQEDSR